MSSLLRWPTEDPRVVLVGRVVDDAPRWNMLYVELIDGELKGGKVQACATEDLAEGDLVRVDAGMARRLPQPAEETPAGA